MTSIDNALIMLDNYLYIPGIDAYDLKAFADEDTAGGRNAGFDGWSIDIDEGKLLYALVRALKPSQAIEIGVRAGASTAHLLAALDANGDGVLDSYDLDNFEGVTQTDNWTFHQEDALTAGFRPAEFVFEDGGHGLDFSLRIFEKLKAFAHVVVTHDINMTQAHGDFHVREAFDTVFPDGMSVVLDGCERGLGVWVNPDWVAPEVEQVIEEAPVKVAPQSKPKAPPAKKPAATRKPAAKKATRTAKR